MEDIYMTTLPPRMQDTLYHDIFLPVEVIEVRDEVREFAQREIEPVACEIAQQEESEDNFPWDIFNKMAQEKIFGIPFDEKWGGRGLKYPSLATCVALEELAYASNSIASIVDVHCILAGHALNYGSDRVKETYLKPLVAGEKIGCFATTEPEASSDLSVRSLRTKAKRKGNGWVVNGQKRFITNACVADFVVALVAAEGKLHELVIELNWPGVRVGEPDKKMGNRGQLTSDIYFDDVEVPEENLVGEFGKGLHVALGTLTYGRVGIGATGVGMAQAAFDESVDYMKKRSAFGRKIGQYQYWQFRLADRLTEIENARNLYCKAAYRLDHGVEFPEPEAAMAKYYGTRLGVDMARDGVQIFAGYGFMRMLSHDKSTYKVEQILRDSKIAEIYEGTNEIQKMIIARQLFGKELTG
jgi:butyryl-CoA dehydrogenase